MFWYQACVHLLTEFEPERRFEWTPTEDAISTMASDHPEPIRDWSRSITEIGTDGAT